MSLRLQTCRAVLCGAVLAIGMTTAELAHAQLGSVNNPPPQNVFKFSDTPTPRNDGLGTMAERRRALARSKTRRPVHRQTN